MLRNKAWWRGFYTYVVIKYSFFVFSIVLSKKTPFIIYIPQIPSLCMK